GGRPPSKKKTTSLAPTGSLRRPLPRSASRRPSPSPASTHQASALRGCWFRHYRPIRLPERPCLGATGLSRRHRTTGCTSRSTGTGPGGCPSSSGSDELRGRRQAGGAAVSEEVVALVVDKDEGREFPHLDLPHGLHAELGVLQHLHLRDVLLREDRGRPAHAAQVESPVH